MLSNRKENQHWSLRRSFIRKTLGIVASKRLLTYLSTSHSSNWFRHPHNQRQCRAFGAEQASEGDNFLLFDSGWDDKDRMLKFVTDENLEALESNTVWHAKQSALESMSRFILPNFTIHAVDNVRTVPSVFFLLQNKRAIHSGIQTIERNEPRTWALTLLRRYSMEWL